MADEGGLQKPDNRQHNSDRQGEDSEQNIKLAVKEIRGELQLILISYICYSFSIEKPKREIINMYACHQFSYFYVRLSWHFSVF